MDNSDDKNQIILLENDIIVEQQLDSLLPKSRDKYEAAFKKFEKWFQSFDKNVINDKSVLSYLIHLENTFKYKPTTIRSIHSMIKQYLKAKKDINIENYLEVNLYLRKISKNHIPKKSKVFSNDELKKFLIEAPDHIYLGKKAVTVVALSGACHCDQLRNFLINDVVDDKDEIVVKIKTSKNSNLRSFTILGEFYSIIKKYLNLRNNKITTPALFIKYYQGRCYNQPVGKNTIAKVPQEIAKFLNFKDPRSYTGHAFRRTFDSILVDEGRDMKTLKRHGDWQSTNVAEGSIDESKSVQKKVNNMLLNSLKLNNNDSTPNCTVTSASSSNKISKSISDLPLTNSTPTAKSSSTSTSEPTHNSSSASTSVNESSSTSEPTRNSSSTLKFTKDLKNQTMTINIDNVPNLVLRNCTNVYIHYNK